MADLIDPESRQWDLNLLQGLFNPSKENLIKSFPLCNVAMEDKVIWPHTPSGKYTV